MTREIGDSKMTFTYQGFGKNLEYVLDGEDADYLPKAMVTFAQFLRSVGFGWVAVRNIPTKRQAGFTTDEYLFHSDYQWKTSDEEGFAEDWHRASFTVEEPEDEQEEINRAAHDYWDIAVDEAAYEPYDVGDTVYYNAKGNPDEQHGHNGRTGVKLNMMRGTVVKISDSPLGRRVLVKFDNWNDGHNGMGDDPDARVGASNYWWTDVNNVSLTS